MIKNKTDFTLIELLVVVSIIMILASLLLPALKKTHETAKKIHCAGNMKQLAFGLGMYLQDNNSYYPTAFNNMGTIKVNRYWFDLIKDNINATPGNSLPLYRGSCLECRADGDRFAADGTMYTSYFYLYIFWTNYATRDIFAPKIKSPGSIGILSEGWSSFGYPGSQARVGPEGGRDIAYSLRARHSGRLNIVYCDGHVASDKVVVGQNLRAIFDAQ